MGMVAVTACGSGGGAKGGSGGTGGTTTGAGGGAAGATGTGGATGSDAGQTVGTGGADAGASCAPRMVSYGGGETSLPTTTVTAAIVDETGAPVASEIAYICGIDLCWDPAMTGADGKVMIASPFAIKKPAFKYGDTINYALFLAPLTMPTTDFTAGNQVLATGKLSDKPGATLAAGSDAKSGDVTVSIPAGATVGIDTLVYDTAENQKFRAVNVPLTHTGPVLASANFGGAAPGFVLLYGVAPEDTIVCPAAKITVALPHVTTAPNDFGWPPGTAVEFWILGDDNSQQYAPYAGWAKMSDGVVGSDGTSVSTSDGPQQGFLLLANFAIRKAP